MLQLLTLSLFASTAAASFRENLNYHSPSKQHARLGIDIPLVHRRSLKRSSTAWNPAQLNFTHGVASGDPYPDSVILWTRIAPSMAADKSNVTVTGNVPLYNHDTERYIKASPNPICVQYQVAEKNDLGSVVTQGQALTTSDIDFTVKIEAKNLKPFTTYYYQFAVCGSNNTSPVGRTKTAPAHDADVNELKLAVFSCSNHPTGYFNAYGNAARKDKHDYVIHLGDYIYEGGAGGKRAHDPKKIIFSLFDYRTRLGQYRTDPDLLLLHRNFPWITVWDDHEVSNNGYRDGSSALNNTEESFINGGPRVSVDQRKMNAVRAYFEWMPLRQVDMDDNLRIWRSFQLGNLMDLIMLDTRNYDRSITSLGWNDNYIDLIHDDAGRTLMGSRQENWFYNQLSASSSRGATWRVIGNQIIFSRIARTVNGKFTVSGDDWNGYTANRNRTFQHWYDNKISNNIFLAGDSHRNWASDLVWLDHSPYSPETGEGSIGVEFAGTAVSSSGSAGPITAAESTAKSYVMQNPELQRNEGYYRGYYYLVVTQQEASAQFYGSPSVATRNAWDISLANFTVRAGENHLSRPIAGGRTEAGYLQTGLVKHTNVTLNTETGQWEVIGFDQMYL